MKPCASVPEELLNISRPGARCLGTLQKSSMHVHLPRHHVSPDKSEWGETSIPRHVTKERGSALFPQLSHLHSRTGTLFRFWTLMGTIGHSRDLLSLRFDRLETAENDPMYYLFYLLILFLKKIRWNKSKNKRVTPPRPRGAPRLGFPPGSLSRLQPMNISESSWVGG